MTGFADWLKQLVFTVVLATLADMVMPGKTLQPYLRTVLGLAIIATMIQPLLPMLHTNWADQVATQAEQEFANAGQTATGKLAVQGVPLTTIRQQLQSQTQTMADDGLATEIRQAVEVRFHCTVNHVHVAGLTDTTVPLSVSLTVTNSSSASLPTIQQYVAQLLEVNSKQITVQLG